MPRVLLATLWVFLAITACSALLTIGGVAWVWYSAGTNGSAKDLPYLGGLLTSVIVEVVGVIILLARRGLRYLPKVITHRKELVTLEFMHDLIHQGSTVTIVSNRASWLLRHPRILQSIKDKSSAGKVVEVLVSDLDNDDLRRQLVDAGVAVYELGGPAPEARFTLVNGSRTGAEVLAIARGTHPDHEVTVFDGTSGPQIIAMAKDIVRTLKQKAVPNAS